MIFQPPSILCPCSRSPSRLKSFFGLSLPISRVCLGQFQFIPVVLALSLIVPPFLSQKCSSLVDISYGQPVHSIESLIQFMNFFISWPQAVLPTLSYLHFTPQTLETIYPENPMHCYTFIFLNKLLFLPELYFLCFFHIMIFYSFLEAQSSPLGQLT